MQTLDEGCNAAELRMSRFASLSPAETAALRDLPRTSRRYPAQAELCREGGAACLAILLTGWACEYRMLGDGRRQIIRFLLPGDALGLLDRPTLPSTTSVLALTAVTVADARPLIRMGGETCAPMPGVAAAIATMSHADEISLRDQVVRIGRQTAYERLVSLMLELHQRLLMVGMADDDSFPLPLTQEILSDALGLSVVHVNRTLQQVRRDRLFDLRGGRVTLHQLPLMRARADWVEQPR